MTRALGHCRGPGYLLASLALGFIVTRVYASLLAVLAEPLAGDLALTSAELGAVASAFPFALALAQPVNGVLLDRYGPGRVVPLLLVVAVLGTAMFAFAESRTTLIVGYALIGFGVSATLMGSLLALSTRAPPRQLATLTGILMATGGLGQVLSATPLAYLTTLLGWRAAVLCLAGLAVLAGLAIALTVPPRALDDRSVPEPVLRSFRGYLDVVRQPGFVPVFALSCTGFAAVFVTRGLWAGPWLSTGFGLGPVAVGHALLAMTIGMIVGTAAYGPLDRLAGSRKRIVLAGALASIATLCLLAMSARGGVAVAIALLVVLGLAGTYDAVLLAHGRALFPAHLAGRGITALNVGTFMGVGLVQVSTGFLTGGMIAAPGSSIADAYSALFLYLALLVGIGALAYAFTRDVPP